MTPKSVINDYRRIMGCVDVDNAVKQQIIKNCARYSTMKKLRTGKYHLTAVIKENTTEKI